MHVHSGISSSEKDTGGVELACHLTMLPSVASCCGLDMVCMRPSQVYMLEAWAVCGSGG